MKRILRGLVVLLLYAPAAGAEFEGVADMKISTTGGPTGEAVAGAGKIYVSRTGWRYEIEMSSPEMAHATGGQSFRMCMVGKVAEPDVVYSVNDAMKTYAVIYTREMRELAARDCKVTVMPAAATAADILAARPHGIMLSYGPGDPATSRLAAGRSDPFLSKLLAIEVSEILREGLKTKTRKQAAFGADSGSATAPRRKTFFHPECTVDPGISPGHALDYARGLSPTIGN